MAKTLQKVTFQKLFKNYKKKRVKIQKVIQTTKSPEITRPVSVRLRLSHSEPKLTLRHAKTNFQTRKSSL
jgi:hypothetical protein